MKPIKKIAIYVQASVLVCFVAGCDDFLTQTNPTDLTINNYFTKPEHVESTVNAIYADLRTVTDGGGLSGAAWLMLEMPTGLANTVALGAAGQKNPPILNLTNTPANEYMLIWWNSSYKAIANANVVIAKTPSVPMDPALAKRYLGVSKFLRAFNYYNLVRIFGEVPLVTEPVDVSSDQLFPERASIADVYKLIVEDLQAAEQSGLSFKDESGRVSLGAVKTLLASVYLTMAGYPLQAGADYYALARDKAAEVMSSGQFALFDSYEDLRKKATENSGEHIFMIQYDQSIINRMGFQEIFLPYNTGISQSGSEAGMLFPQQEFVASYEPGDKRVEEKQFYFTEYTLKADRTRTVQFAPHIYKWHDPVAVSQTGLSGLNWPLLRYAEVLFIYAEAENEASGPTQAAFDAVNEIRNRAELPDLSGLSQAELREAIWREKWHEMCWENKTWFDMVRLRKAYNPVTNLFEDFVGYKFVYGPTLSETELLFPIPLTEIGNNSHLSQNPGY